MSKALPLMDSAYNLKGYTARMESKMIPFQQGWLDSLCGIGGIVNSEKILNNTNAEDSKKLFNEIVSFLEKKKQLSSILTGGMLLKNMKSILNEVIGEKIPNKELRFCGKPNPSLGTFWEEVSDFLKESQGRSVIFCLSGVHDHWTTIRKITAKQIMLFDSDGGALKYCLCAILFSLRMRRMHPDFLQPNDHFCNELVNLVKEGMCRIQYPASMLTTVQDLNGEGLNGLVLRFLMQTADKDDYQAIEGLTTSMS